MAWLSKGHSNLKINPQIHNLHKVRERQKTEQFDGTFRRC